MNKLMSRRFVLAAVVALCSLVVTGSLTIAQTGDDPAIAFFRLRSSSSDTFRELVVMNADGSNQTVLWSRSGPINQISWSPDLNPDIPGYQGSLVMEVQSEPGYGTFSLWIVDVTVTPGGITGTNLRNLIASAGFNPAWSPRGDWIAFDSGSASASYGINVISPAGGSPTLIVPAYSGYSATSEPTWNPDGTHIAYKGANKALVTKQVVDPTTGLLIDGPETTVIPGGTFTDIFDSDWSRSGNRIAFEGITSSVGKGGKTTSTSAVYTVDSTGTVTGIPNTGSSTSPAWSPDDRFLVYARRLKSTDGRSLVRQELVTGATTVIAAGSRFADLRFPDWRRVASVFDP